MFLAIVAHTTVRKTSTQKDRFSFMRKQEIRGAVLLKLSVEHALSLIGKEPQSGQAPLFLAVEMMGGPRRQLCFFFLVSHAFLVLFFVVYLVPSIRERAYIGVFGIFVFGCVFVFLSVFTRDACTSGYSSCCIYL